MKSSLEKISGLTALIVTLMYTGISLPSQILKIYETKDVSGISLFMVIMLSLTFLSWIIYALSKKPKDWLIVIPNSIGFVGALTMLILYIQLS